MIKNSQIDDFVEIRYAEKKRGLFKNIYLKKGKIVTVSKKNGGPINALVEFEDKEVEIIPRGNLFILKKLQEKNMNEKEGEKLKNISILILIHESYKWDVYRRVNLLRKLLEEKILFSEFIEKDDQFLIKELGLFPFELEFVEKIRKYYGIKMEELSKMMRNRSMINILPIFSKRYPKLIRDCGDKNSIPLLFYVRGNVNILNKECIGIVGSRDASNISLNFIEKIVKKVLNDNTTIVSGFSRGTDKKALDEVLKQGGTSIIIPAQGILTFIRNMNWSLTYEKYIKNGRLLILNHFNPLHEWKTHYALNRNKIIYNISKEIYIPESGFSGGTWSGAKYGLSRNKKIHVRKANDSENNGNNKLIENGCIGI